jgi:hypothetical protein
MTDPADPAVYVACRCADVPDPSVPSQRLGCAQCAQPVWIDPLRYIPVKLGENGSLRVLCVPCVADLVLKRHRTTGRPA